MKTILTMLALSALALSFDLDLAAFGLIVVAVVLALGDKAQANLPETACTQNCQQGDACTCRAKGAAKS